MDNEKGSERQPYSTNPGGNSASNVPTFEGSRFSPTLISSGFFVVGFLSSIFMYFTNQALLPYGVHFH